MTNAWCVLHGLALHDGWCALHRGGRTCGCDHFARQSGGVCTCPSASDVLRAGMTGEAPPPEVKKAG